MVSKDTIIEQTIEKMEKTYKTGFDLVDYDYNKGSGQHEISLQSKYTENNQAIRVVVEGKNNYFDDYNNTRWCTEILNTYLTDLDIGVKYYAICEPPVELTTPIGYYDSYEDYKSNNSDVRFYFTIYVDTNVDSDAESILRNKLESFPYQYKLRIIRHKFLSASKCANMEQTHSRFYTDDNFINGIYDYEELLEIDTIQYTH